MKTEKNILIAFILNLAFSIFEFIGGTITGSVAIISDALHDIGDATSIGLSYFLERKSKKQPDEIYTYGYTRYSVVAGMITSLILILGSVLVIYNAINRIFNPVPIDYNGMIFFAIIGTIINFCAAMFTKEGNSINEKAVNLHLLEDVLGWIVVLLGAIIMHFTNITIIDPILSIGVAIFILINATKNAKEILDLFLEKIPSGINVEEIKEHIYKIKDVQDIHHIHIWSMDGQNNYATMHIVTDAYSYEIKEKIKTELKKLGICHVTLEFETINEHCHSKLCEVDFQSHQKHHH